MGILAGPAMAQDNDQDGLVNVNIQDTTIAIPIGVAANVCANLNVVALATEPRTGDQDRRTGDATVDHRLIQRFADRQAGGQGPGV